MKKMINFAVADRYAEARSGFERRDADIMESVYYALFLDSLKLRNFQDSSRMRQTVDANVDMYIPPTADTRVWAIGVFTHILREASACLLVQRIRACEGLSEWNEQQYGSHAFSL